MRNPLLTGIVSPIMNFISKTHIYVVGPTIHVRGGLHIYL